MIKSYIVGTGSYIPDKKVSNVDFLQHEFFDKNGARLSTDSSTLIKKFKEISGIDERRYAAPEQQASDLAFLAAQEALENSGFDKETLDYIIVAHNFGDVAHEDNRSSFVPTLASRVKYLLQIKNPDCVAYDLPFGCPGWLEAMIQANYFIRSGDAQRCLVIGTETLSRVIDPHDRDSMLYGDGAGAVILAGTENGDAGILAHKTRTYASEHAMLLNMAHSYDADYERPKDLFIKMNGRKVYEFALSYVPLLITDLLEKTGLTIDDITKVLIHQANEKMDTAILERILKLAGKSDASIPAIMPMTISWMGNNSVATIPTLLDLICKGKMAEHHINKGDKVIMASVGAGMNINGLIYQF